MKIIIDGRTSLGRLSGVGYFTQSIIERLPAFDTENSYCILRSRISVASHPFSDLWLHGYAPIVTLLEGVDVYYSPAFFLPAIIPGVRKIVTIHDMAVFLHPEFFPAKFAWYLQKAMSAAIRSADHIFTMTATVKDELLSLFNKIKAERVTAIYESVASHWTAAESRLESELPAATNTPYILHVGTLEPRKNLAFLISAFLKIKEKISVRLVLVGQRGWLSESLERRIEAHQNDILWLGYVSEAELRSLYRNAAVVVFPSRYEGFGLPILEAAAAGAPLLVSDIGVFREILGRGTYYFSLSSETELVEKLTHLLTHEAARKLFIPDGQALLERFSWKNTCRRMVECF